MTFYPVLQVRPYGSVSPDARGEDLFLFVLRPHSPVPVLRDFIHYRHEVFQIFALLRYTRPHGAHVVAVRCPQ